MTEIWVLWDSQWGVQPRLVIDHTNSTFWPSLYMHKCNGWDVWWNGTTGAPMSVLCYVVDKVKLLGIVNNFISLICNIVYNILTLWVFIFIRGTRAVEIQTPNRESWSLTTISTEDRLRHASGPVHTRLRYIYYNLSRSLSVSLFTCLSVSLY